MGERERYKENGMMAGEKYVKGRRKKSEPDTYVFRYNERDA